MTLQNNLTMSLKYDKEHLATMLAQALPADALVVFHNKRAVQLVVGNKVIPVLQSSFAVEKLDPWQVEVRVTKQVTAKSHQVSQGVGGEQVADVLALEKAIEAKINTIAKKIKMLKPNISHEAMAEQTDALIEAQVTLASLRDALLVKTAELADRQAELRRLEPAPEVVVKLDVADEPVANAAVLQAPVPTVARYLETIKGAQINPIQLGEEFTYSAPNLLGEGRTVQVQPVRTITGEEARAEIKSLRQLGKVQTGFNGRIHKLYVLFLEIPAPKANADDFSSLNLYARTYFGWQNDSGTEISGHYDKDHFAVTVAGYYGKDTRPLLQIYNDDESNWIALMG